MEQKFVITIALDFPPSSSYFETISEKSATTVKWHSFREAESLNTTN